jgi:hypothetical protein
MPDGIFHEGNLRGSTRDFTVSECGGSELSGVFYQSTQPGQAVNRKSSRFGCAPVLAGAYNDSARIVRRPDARPDAVPCPAAPPPSTVHNPAPPLTIICPDCAGEGSLYTSKFGGNDPDVWRTGPCHRCDQTGYAVLQCNHCGQADAIEWFEADPLCAACSTIAREDACLEEGAA